MTNPGAALSSGPIAWIDARNGIAGDMLLAALLDAGASLAAVEAAVEAVLPATVRLRVSEVRRAGMRASRLDVDTLVDDLPHRDWRDIRTMLEAAELGSGIRNRALAVFAALAAAEARAHGIEAEEVHFHEVGAWDSIADIVGVCAALANLGVGSLCAGPVGLGSGSIRTAHGEIPVPVPAVVELSRGWPVLAGGTGELATPTGMALLAALAQAAPLMPSGTVRGVGVGAGTRDDAHRPNVVRVILLEASVPGEVPASPGTVVIEANVDDLDPRVWPGVLEALLAAGADDAWLAPIVMKKGRPAHTLSVLCPDNLAGLLRERVFALTPTLGVREYPVSKHMLDRTWRAVDVGPARVRIKLGHAAGLIVTATPEYADVITAAHAAGRAEHDVLAAAIAAADAAGLRPGAGLPGDGVTP